MATDTREPHSASAVSAIAKAILAETFRSIRTWAPAAQGTAMIAAKPAAMAERTDMNILPGLQFLSHAPRPAPAPAGCAIMSSADGFVAKSPKHVTEARHRSTSPKHVAEARRRPTSAALRLCPTCPAPAKPLLRP